MDIKKYKVFERAVELSSLTKAGAELNLTQSGVSHIIKDIEEELGLTLLKRGKMGVSLTTEGEKIYPYIQNIIQASEELLNKVSEVGSLSSGKLRIGTFTSVGTNWLPGMIKSFAGKHPGIEYQILNGDYYDIDNWIIENKVDIAFVSLPTKLKCKVIPLWDDELVAILPKGHPLSSKSSCNIEDIAKEDFITILESSNHDAKRAFEGTRLKPNIRLTTKDDYAVIAMVRQGLGVSIMPSLLLKDNSRDIEIRSLNPQTKRTIALLISQSSPSPATKSFAEFAQNWIQENKDNLAVL